MAAPSDSDAKRPRRASEEITERAGNDPEEGERRHFLDVCHSLRDYRRDAIRDVARVNAEYAQLDPMDAKLWNIDIEEWVRTANDHIVVNSKFLNLLPHPDVCGAQLEERHIDEVYQMPSGHRVQARNSSKVRSTLKQFVRDWAKEGEEERAQTYLPIIEALKRHLPPGVGGKGKRGKQTVLCPGSGLGRLPFELAFAGYAAQGNEFSYHMILGMHLVFTRTRQEGAHLIYPFSLSRTNRKESADNFQGYRVPVPCPALALPPEADMSMASGEFVAVYEKQVGEWDAVATAFFLDTAKNPMLYIRTIASLIRPGGVWVNLGPLLYHYAEDEHEMSVELSWEELRPFISKYFTLAEEEHRYAEYTTNPGSMLRTRYNAMLCVAIRNGRPVDGTSNPVY